MAHVLLSKDGKKLTKEQIAKREKDEDAKEAAKLAQAKANSAKASK